MLVVETPPVKNGTSWTYCVDNASKTGWDFDQSINASLLCGAPPPPPPPATTGLIAGVVTDTATGSPLPGATTSSDSGETDTADSAGNYMVTDVPTGMRTVTVSATGYDPDSQTILVEEGLTSTLNISLTPTTVGGGTGTLKGTVKSGGAKIAGALVQIVDGPSATTNKGGKFTIQNVPEGVQNVTATHVSAGSYSGSVTIQVGVTTTLNINLNP